jgi:drug/metabolite transporter (DMT)-like permease
MTDPSRTEDAPRAARPSRLAVVGICAVAILALSTASIFIVKAQQAGGPSLVIAAYRLAFCTLVLLPFALTRGRHELRALTRRDVSLALVSGVFLAAHFASWIASLEYTSVASSVVLVCSSPLFVALLAPLALKEPLTRPVFLGVLLAVTGAAVVGLSDAREQGEAVTWSGGTALLGNALALLGAITVACYFLIGRRLRAKLSLLTYIFLTYGSAAVVLLLWLPLTGHAYLGHPAEVYGWCLLLALVPQLIGHTTFNWALRYVPAANIGVLVVGEPVGTIALAWIVLGQPPLALGLVGAALILGGIYLASTRRAPPLARDPA